MLPESIQKAMIQRNPTVYGNLREDLYLHKFKKQGNTYLVQSPDNFNWDIKNEYKIIEGYKCRKAVLKVEESPKLYFIAWFTTQIPVAFSPVRYYGLPGAILEVTTPMKHIYAKNIEFKEDVEVEKPTDGIKLTAKEYKEMMGSYGSN